MSDEINKALDDLDAEDVVINFYDEEGPAHITAEDQRRIRRYAKEQGIFEVKVGKLGGYLSFIATKWSPSGFYERWRRDQGVETRVDQHLASVRSDTPQGGDEPGDSNNGRSK